MGAHAGGFIVHDLSTVAADARAALGVGFIRKAEAARLILSCLECKGEHVVDVQLGRQDDGTEQRVRSGQTTMARLEALCRARSPTCTLSALEVSPAVGWITTYPLGAGFGSTAVVLRDGDLLTIRSLAADEPTAKSNAEKTLKAVAGKVVGKQTGRRAGVGARARAACELTADRLRFSEQGNEERPRRRRMILGERSLGGLGWPSGQPGSCRHGRNAGGHVGAVAGPMGRDDRVSRRCEQRLGEHAEQEQCNRGDGGDPREHGATLSVA
jgi:hypothetical protein